MLQKGLKWLSGPCGDQRHEGCDLASFLHSPTALRASGLHNAWAAILNTFSKVIILEKQNHLRGNIIDITWVMYKNMNKGKTSTENFFPLYQMYTPCLLKT